MRLYCLRFVVRSNKLFLQCVGRLRVECTFKHSQISSQAAQRSDVRRHFQARACCFPVQRFFAKNKTDFPKEEYANERKRWRASKRKRPLLFFLWLAEQASLPSKSVRALSGPIIGLISADF